MNNNNSNSNHHSSSNTSPTLRFPRHGEHAADLIFDTYAGARFEHDLGEGKAGAWIYPAAYDDYALACRRAASLARGFGLPFSVDLFGAEVASAGPTPSVAVAEPGYYAYTLADPRPHLIDLDTGRYWSSRQSEQRLLTAGKPEREETEQ